MATKLTSLIAVLVFSVCSLAGERKAISGSVTDLDGHPLPKATLVIENAKTHRRITIHTDADGKFVVKNLKGTDYSVILLPELSKNGATLHLDGTQSSPDSNTEKQQRAAKRGRAATTVTAR